MITSSFFTRLSDGREVTLYRITNDYGEFVEILNYGACIYRLSILDKFGKPGDVVLGIHSPEEIETGRFAGITIGRCANRIANGRFTLNGKTIQLECNQGGHHLHGAGGNYGKQLFRQVPTPIENQLCLHYTDTGLGGYGNKAEAFVYFTFGNDRSLSIRYHMHCEEDTLLCPTNHAYFNLDGTPDICSHTLKLFSDRYAVKGQSGIPEGQTAPVSGTPLDFTSARPIGDALQDNASGFFPREIPEIDDTFLLGHRAGTLALAAQLKSSVSGREMDVYTDMPALIVFTMFVKNPVIGKDETVYQGYNAVALETQYVPNAVNCETFEKPVFEAGRVLDSTTIYKFRTIQEG